MPEIEVEPGLSLFVQDVGSGPPVVLLAGLGLCHEVWDGQVRALAASRRVLCVDLRGTGRSAKPAGDYSLDRIVRDVQAVLDELDLHDVTLAGWSFGGQVAFRLAAVAPERLNRIALICSNGVRASRSEAFPFGPDAEPLEAALVRAELETRIESRRRSIRSGFCVKPSDEVLDWLVRIQLQMPSWSALPSYRTYLHSDLVDDLPAVTLPVLQIMGAEDPVTPVDGAHWVQERLADGRLLTLDGCGHYPMFEMRERFDDALLDFANGQGRM